MSVLIETLTLVVPTKVLDVSYPGGTMAFAEALLHLAQPPRFICTADPTLLSASFHDHEQTVPAMALLEQHGIIEVDDDRFIEMAWVDQRYGPTMPCDWLEWRRHKDGFTYAWLAGTEPGDMAVPEDWTPEQSRRMVRKDIRDEPGRCIPLAEENGIETWLDFQTGQLIAGLPQRDPPGMSPDHGARAVATEVAKMKETLLPIVTGAFDERGLVYSRISDHAVLARMWDHNATFDLFVTTDDAARTVVCLCSFSARVMADATSALRSSGTRANWGLLLGAFEMDFTDGEVRFRTSIDVEGGQLASTMVHNLVWAAVSTAGRYHDAIMRVAFGGVDAATAIHEAEATPPE